MATIGTATIKIKPTLDDAALDAITKRISDAVELGVARGMARVQQKRPAPVCVGDPCASTTVTTIDGKVHRPA